MQDEIDRLRAENERLRVCAEAMATLADKLFVIVRDVVP